MIILENGLIRLAASVRTSWHGGHCGYCDACRSGNSFGCSVALKITGISFDGGYADYMVALASVPDDLSAVDSHTS